MFLETLTSLNSMASYNKLTQTWIRRVNGNQRRVQIQIDVLFNVTCKCVINGEGNQVTVFIQHHPSL